MILDFNNMQEAAFEHFKGGEGTTWGKMFFDGVNRVLHGRLPKGSSIGMHTHEDSCEVIYVLSGEGNMLMEGQEEILRPGMATYCPKGGTHSLRNFCEEDLVFLAVVPQQ